MIKYQVGDLIDTYDDMWLVIEANTENCLPWEQTYKVVSQSNGEEKKVKLVNLAHRCI
jgi:hypothetical protein